MSVLSNLRRPSYGASTKWMLVGILTVSGCAGGGAAESSLRTSTDDTETLADESVDDDAEPLVDDSRGNGAPGVATVDRGTRSPSSPRTPSIDTSDEPTRDVTSDDADGADSDDDVATQETGPAPTAESASRKGPHAVKTYTSGYRNGPRYADSTIHYPEGAEGKLPAVAIVPGFASPQSSIKAWGPFLASHGIIAMTFGTNSTSDPPQTRAGALLDALETIRTEDARMGSPLNGKVDASRLGVMGWSMGGGGTLIAANTTPTLKAAVSLCGWNPGGRYAQMKVPSLMFAATSDPLAGGQSQGFYASIPESTPKMIFEVSGGSHGYANSPSGQGGKVGLFGLSWLKIHLVGDARYKSLIMAKPSGLATFKTNLQ